MVQITLERVNRNVLLLKSSLDRIRNLIEENSLDLTDEVKNQIKESRMRHFSEFKSQEEIEKRFL